MRLWVAIILGLSILAPLPAQAGPWLREKGSGFTSLSVTGTAAREYGVSTYLEYGWRDRMTLGADISTAMANTGGNSGFATLFLRRALGPNKGRNRLAYELGAGASWDGALITPHLRAGVSWGRGYQLRNRGGWMTVEAALRWDLSGDQHLAKVDTTLGLNFNDVTTGMVQLYLSHLDQKFFATFAPSVVIKPRKRNFRIQLGLETPVDAPETTALKLGLWREF